ncbi:MAG: formylmethanofuran dehydrogenase subunit E family protein [Candidatus Thermoplasmatota archaeon]|nr:formylmethanofuran dehydrogenase subunit E family protein [Candidatus Thermoplasmatota archaeon]
MNEELKQIKRFHGHLGPYAVIGYRMGKLANRMLGEDPFTKRAIVWNGTTPPLSCIIDGLQLASGCTLGKGNITVHSDGITKARFINKSGKSIEISLKSAVKNDIDTTVTEKNMIGFSEKLYQRPDNELFDIELSEIVEASFDSTVK